MEEIVTTPPNVVTTEWVSKLTGFSTQTVCRLARQRKIPGAYKAFNSKGSDWKFQRNDVMRWFRSIKS